MDNSNLFRGKRVDTGEWITGQVVYFGKQPFIVGEVVDWDDEYISLESWWKVDPASVGRCTGLSAAKSYRGESEAERLIFEGDIVKNDIAKGIVKFGNPDFLKDSLCSMFYWEMTEQLDYTHFCFEDDVFTEFKGVEIIGTVFDESEGTE